VPTWSESILAGQAGDSFEPDALSVLAETFSQICTEGRIDEFGNGRFVRSLFERACAYRDIRVAQLGEAARATDLTIVTAHDLVAAYQELTGSRLSDEAVLSDAD
jgi:AAA lid domain